MVRNTLFLCLWAASVWAQQSPVKTEVQADRRVTFRLLAPKAAEVTVTGEFQQGAKALQKDDKGVWSLTVGPLEPEIYNYNFTIDGVKTIDPSNPNVKSGSTASTISSVLEIPGDRPAFYDGQAVPHGEVHTHWYHSKSLNELRRVSIYTPPGYDARTRYPVLYLFHGANADETAWVRLGHANLILDNLLAAGKAKPFVVVMPFGYGVPPSMPQAENTARFGRDLMEDLIPYVQSRFHVAADRDHRAIAGLSMGGGESLTIGLNHLELFSYVAGFSAAIRTAELSKTYASLVADSKKSNQQLHLLWIGCGTEDSLFAASKGFSQFLGEHQVKNTFRETPGAHTWMVWRRYLNEFAPLLFQ